MKQNNSLHTHVFFISSAIIFLMVAIAALFPEAATDYFQTIQGQIVEAAGWFYVLVVATISLSVVYFALSRFGDIKLGPDHSQPDYSYSTWFAMLFSAGIGIGLLFFGVAEPVMHYIQPPLGEPGTLDAARESLKLTFFHWGLHAWAIYAIVGLSLAYFGYRHGLPLTLRSALYPLIGEKVHGGIGNAVDIFAIIGTVLGVATSLGYGVAQINAGLNYLGGVNESVQVQILIIIAVTAFATASVLSGLDRGIRRLSEVNMALAISLMTLVFIVGPSLLLLQTFVQNTGNYLSDLVSKTFNLYAYDPTDWLGGWTIFYWGWWISWSPFVGMFIARISRGRSIREFVLGVMLVPAGFTFLWMTIFGNSAIDIINQQGPELAQAVKNNNALALFKFLEYFPLSNLLAGLAIVMVVIFFVTSADSGALVVNMLSSNGEDKTPVWQRLYWCSMIGIVAIILLLAGGLASLQTATIIGALPFSVVLLLIIYALYKSLHIELLKRRSLRHTMNTTPSSIVGHPGEDSWKERIENLAQLPKASPVKEYIASTATSALQSVADELESCGYQAKVNNANDRVTLSINHGSEIDFKYSIRLRRLQRPGFTLATTMEGGKNSQDQHYYRAEPFLNEGSQNYDVMGYSKEQLINDVLDHYEKHRHFLDMIR
ncbi:choline BCCT transporter BetT [Pseudomaricurvus alkylphenolicus]|uniref:BCCT family transporter n=1 Tax=Pseudomaricurvus alkylphenolicus TaxID=1306991 RepID=UPI0014201014|nr:choline BCCT transporter BetT [Pseudomaricurvus alkylphenolicus]NIB40656.1 choline BCCT transporter BetT [Pseudomaricurvus alkylphenolicus]